MRSNGSDDPALAHNGSMHMTTAHARSYPIATWHRDQHARREGGLDITVEIGAAQRRNDVGPVDGARRVGLGQAIALGLVSEEGYLTALGHRFWR